MKIEKILLIIAVIIPCAFLSADSFSAGTPFLMIFPAPRATAMGAAFSTIADDASATYYNPAGLGFINTGQVTLVHSPWLRGLAPDLYHEFTAFTYPLPVGTLGGNIIFLYYGKIEGVSEDQYLGTWAPYDVQVQFSYGYKLSDNWSVGGDVKFIHSFLAPEDILYEATGIEGGGSGTTFAVGAGALFKTKLKFGELRYSLVLDNFGPGLVITSTGERDPLPYYIRTGIALIPIDVKNHNLKVSLEITKILVNIVDDYREKGIGYVSDDAWKHAGLEYTFLNMVSLRGGYFLDELGARKGVTFGLGVRIGNFNIDISDDHYIYSFEQGMNLRYGLSYVFKM
ncbi:MAG TPA: PorV/PorQ family protein [Candidatus Hydrothermia bacterium]|nr:PorV/PorQ family protein [Candidatus Hydrothermae bacterium]MDD3649709.1 PorV/PorQ family protein [Candidatus Hydrothermia bacterium]MDD5573309.1 PorV/PorQ family protein [Candidatus Hydrothermia bacterium]HOK23597.1 PorV/PorQ family protein [Candidatus Hydrothermia bacterium]HOL24353.1 PorV/PorQ family protein [Candidatus Hydrothermia bacterium]